MENKNSIIVRIGTQGWKQFLTAKKEIIDRFDRAKEYAKTHEVETYHGIVAEEGIHAPFDAGQHVRFVVTVHIAYPGVRTMIGHFNRFAVTTKSSWICKYWCILCANIF